MCGFSLSVALKRLFLRCLASLFIVKKFLLYSNFSNYKCACAYAKIQISVRMPSDVRILHICTEISICITSVWLAMLANYSFSHLSYFFSRLHICISKSIKKQDSE